jgi:hypothetical protein
MADHLAGDRDRPVWSQVEPGEVRAGLPAHPPDAPDDFDAVLPTSTGDPAGHHRLAAPGLVRLLPVQLVSGRDPGGDGAPTSRRRACCGRPRRRSPRSRTWCWTGAWTCSGCPATWRVDSGIGGGVIQATASDATHTALVAARHRRQRRDVPPTGAWPTCRRRRTRRSRRARGPGTGTSGCSTSTTTTRCAPTRCSAAIEATSTPAWRPTFVCSAVGTTGTGAIDPSPTSARSPASHGMWHHVDAAWAGRTWMLPELRSHQDGLDTSTATSCQPAQGDVHRGGLHRLLGRRPRPADRGDVDHCRLPAHRRVRIGRGRRLPRLARRARPPVPGAEAVVRAAPVRGRRHPRRLREHVRVGLRPRRAGEADPRLELVAPDPFPPGQPAHVDGDDATRRLVARLRRDRRRRGHRLGAGRRPYLRIAIGQTGHPGTPRRTAVAAGPPTLRGSTDRAAVRSGWAARSTAVRRSASASRTGRRSARTRAGRR